MFVYHQVLCKALGLELTSLTPGTLLKDFDKINKILKMPSMAPSVGQQKQDSMAPSIVGIPPVTQSTPSSIGPVDPSGGAPAFVGGGGLGFPTGFATGTGGPTSSSSLPPSMLAQQQGSGFANPVSDHLCDDPREDAFIMYRVTIEVVPYVLV